MSEVPLRVRLLLVAGFRVPRRYLAWAVQQIKSEGFPIRFGIARGLFLWPAALIGFGVASILNAGLPTNENLAGALITFPVITAMIGAWIGVRWPEKIRASAIRAQQSGRSGAF